MRQVLRYILLLPAAFIAASYAGALVIVFSAGAGPYADETTGDFAFKAVVVALIATMFVGAVAAVPALIMIILAEIFGLRSSILHLAVGAGIGFVAMTLGIGGEAQGTAAELRIGGAAGAVAGFVYWLIAGRSAGVANTRRDGSDHPGVT